MVCAASGNRMEEPDEWESVSKVALVEAQPSAARSGAHHRGPIIIDKPAVGSDKAYSLASPSHMLCARFGDAGAMAVTVVALPETRSRASLGMAPPKRDSALSTLPWGIHPCVHALPECL